MRRVAVVGIGVVLAAAIGVAMLASRLGGPGQGGVGRYDRDGLSFAYPASWQQRDAGSFVILGTLSIPPACGLVLLDVNCYYEQRLQPGSISVRVSGNAGARGFGGPAVAQKPENARNTELRVDGQAALFSDFDGLGPDDYYGADEVFRWVIARPGDPTLGWTIEADLRGPGVEAMTAELEALIESIRIVR